MENKVEQITNKETNFAKWYTDIVKKADLADYSSVKGCMIIRPYGLAIWELIKKELDRRFRQTGHENIYMPMFIPASLLQKEKDHVEGFAPEVAWVTKGGAEVLTEPLCVRPTSETLFCEHYANIIESYRDLPKLYNQWCSVVRWEKTTRPFLRSTEFLWQEGHTAHATYDEAEAETLRMLDIYENVLNSALAIPVLKGRKTEKEKFAGAYRTYTTEAMMWDGKALQTATSHNFSDFFAKAFDITYTDRANERKYVYQTSWGASTRLIGALIMVHSDDSGLLLPPAVAPVQAVVIPINTHKDGVLERAQKIKAELEKTLRTQIDLTDKTPGYKFAEWEMRGAPLRVEIGPKDAQNNRVILARRDTGEKIPASIDNLTGTVLKTLQDIHENLYERAYNLLKTNIREAGALAEFEEAVAKPGFVKTAWCENASCEDLVKEKFAATARLIASESEKLNKSRCAICGAPAKETIYWGKAY